MGSEEIHWKDYHHGIYQIYHVMIAVTLVPFALLLLEWDTGAVVEKSSTLIHTIGKFLAMAAIAYSYWYAWKGTKTAYSDVSELSLKEKLAEFRKRNAYRYGSLAIGGVIAAVAMWMLPSFIFVLAYFGALIQYSFLRPSENKIVRDLSLSKMERDLLHKEA